MMTTLEVGLMTITLEVVLRIATPEVNKLLQLAQVVKDAKVFNHYLAILLNQAKDFLLKSTLYSINSKVKN